MTPQVTAGEYEYLLNVCGNISTPAAECNGAGSCQTKAAIGQNINAGKMKIRLDLFQISE